MNLRGKLFPNIVESPEPYTLGGDAASRARSVVRLGAGVMLSDGRAAREGLAEGLRRLAARTSAQPAFVAFRPTGDTRENRLEATHEAASLFSDAPSAFSGAFGIVLDLSRLPLGDPAAFVSEARELLAALGSLGVPLVPEVSLLCAPESAGDILMDPHADGLLLADDIGWDDMPAPARKIFFRTEVSPLAAVGGGRVSGKYLLPLAVEWISRFKRQPAFKPVIAGTGMLRPKDVDALARSGVSAIVIGAARKLRPWNVSRIVRRAKRVLKK